MNFDHALVDALRFDPESGHVIREPLGTGYGYWAGGMKVSFDPASGQFVLFYRQRKPLEAGRGGFCAVAVSDDGLTFRDVWTATKDDFAASSIEVGHCLRDEASGEWRLYVSYELRGGPWRIDVIRAPSPQELSEQSRRTVLSPLDYGLRALKDPVVYQRDGRYHVYAVGGPGRTRPRYEGDVLRAGSWEATYLAESADGLYFEELRYTFEATNADSWDGRRARLNCVLQFGDGFLATYDGGRTGYDTYEEWCGLAWSADGRSFERVPLESPWVRSRHGSVRYVYGLPVGDEIFFYYEYTRADLSHDLRVARVPVPLASLRTRVG